MTAAAMARPTSKPLTRFTGGAAGRAGADAGAALGAPLGGPATRAPGAPGGGAGGAGRPEGGGAPAGVPGEVTLAGVDPLAGIVGNLIVAVGFGGKLMRTVSFLPTGFGGTGAPGGLGTFSAIQNCLYFQAKVALSGCQTDSVTARTPARDNFSGERFQPDPARFGSAPGRSSWGGFRECSTPARRKGW
jgi:hypothetical protein